MMIFAIDKMGWFYGVKFINTVMNIHAHLVFR